MTATAAPRLASEAAFSLRGHKAEATALCFIASASHAADGDAGAIAPPSSGPWLVSGDADGWIFVWDLLFRRPIHRWRPHHLPSIGSPDAGCVGGVLCIRQFTDPSTGLACFASQGRNNRLCIWTMDSVPSLASIPSSEAIHQQTTPTDPSPLLDLDINSLNFCRFDMTTIQTPSLEDTRDTLNASNVLIALPGIIDSSLIDIYNATTRTYHYRHIGNNGTTTQANPRGIAMCIRFIPHTLSHTQLLVSYESGIIIAWSISGDCLCVLDAHKEPVMSIDLSLSRDCTRDVLIGASVSADQWLVAFHIHTKQQQQKGNGTGGVDTLDIIRRIKLPSAGIADVRFTSHGTHIITGGWDGIVRVFTTHTSPQSQSTPITIQSAGGFFAHKTSIRALEIVPDDITHALMSSRVGGGNRVLNRGSDMSDAFTVAVCAKDGVIALHRCHVG